MIRVAAIVLVGVLAGCGTAPPVPTIEVRVPVVVPCIKAAPERPKYITEALGPSATDIQYGDALGLDWVTSRGYEAALEAAIAGCVTP